MKFDYSKQPIENITASLHQLITAGRAADIDELVLDNCKLSDKEAREIMTIIKSLPSLITLSLKNNQLTYNQIENLLLWRNQSRQHLSILHDDIFPEMFSPAYTGDRNKQIERLRKAGGAGMRLFTAEDARATASNNASTPYKKDRVLTDLLEIHQQETGIVEYLDPMSKPIRGGDNHKKIDIDSFDEKWFYDYSVYGQNAIGRQGGFIVILPLTEAYAERREKFEAWKHTFGFNYQPGAQLHIADNRYTPDDISWGDDFARSANRPK